MRLPTTSLVSAAVLTSALAACRSTSGACAGQGHFAVTTEIRDAVSGRATAYGAKLVIRSGQYADSTFGSGAYAAKDSLVATTLFAGLDRAGTYSVTVSKPGYQTWVQQDVQAKPVDDCGTVDGVVLQVMLQPITP
jgi:hypothetical protein